MSDMPTPPWGIRVGHDVRNEYANGIERLQTRLLHIGLFLLTVVVLGGGAGVLMVVTESTRATTVAVTVVAGCVVAVLVALVAAMSATRRLTPLVRRAPQPVAAPRTPTVASAVAQPVPVPRQQDAAPLWSEQQVTLTDDPGQRREVFVKLARRLQSLINRAIKRIDELEQENEDPELLDGLYEIDHLFTLARRQGENLAVLGGEAPQRRSNKPVSVYAVLLAAVSEAEHYRQIAIVPVEDVEIHGHAVAEIIHLLAELLENATRFSAPDGPKVEVRAHKVTAGLAIEVQDRGLGMSHEDLDRINSLLDGSTRIDLSDLLSDGRIGLAVVRELARRHHIRVRLQSNIFGGIAAAVVIPPQLLSEPEQETRQHTETPQQSQPPALPKRRPDPAPEPPRPTPATEPAPASRTPEPARVPAPVPIPAATESAGRLAPARLAPPPAHGATVPESPGPVQVPAPMPIPASVPSTAAAPARQSRHRAEAEGDLPALPVRAPGRSYDDLRAGGNGIVLEETPARQGDEPPPLPQRRGSHLRDELLEPPSMTRPVPGHDTNLMKTFQAGRDNWLAQQGDQDRNANKNQGDSWPTT